MSFFRTRNGAAVLAGCLFVFIVLIFIGRSRSHRTNDVIDDGTLQTVGTVTTIAGQADFRMPETLDFKPLAEGASVVSGELLVAHEASQVTVSFPGGASIRLQPGAHVVAERDSSYRNAVMATLVEGDADVLSTGSPHSFRLFKNGRDLTDPNAPVAPTPVVVSGAGRVFGTSPAQEPQAVVTASTPPETPTPAPVARTSDETGTTVSADSLSNEEIRRQLRSAGGFFQRCYLTYLNRVKTPPPSASTITVGFVISNSGKVRDAKIVRTDFNDQVLNGCILETVERTSFRAFKASDIPVLEFPIELR